MGSWHWLAGVPDGGTFVYLPVAQRDQEAPTPNCHDGKLAKILEVIAATGQDLRTEQAIAMSWKSPMLLTLSHWCAAFLKWGRAELVALRREEARGLRKVPVASGCDMHMQELQSFIECIQT
ncbi:hypothetical protein NDU88_001337 [Pleurodeles waltl]|uniref:Uncharacterized protein n=1 Tax=Pleurodeles waltl TaxID=8319 RepID=A0AAV7WNA8_PLEWA|nr:hypothetical protein NDU88_001337 [Pleurodeles waltl]